VSSVPNTCPTRLREKVRTDRGCLDALLDDVRVAHVGIVDDGGSPVVLPVAVARDANRLLLHGSTGSPWLRRAASGVDVCVTVTAVDALVVARSAFESSIHYRSAVLFGRCTVVADGDKQNALDVLTEALIPGRVRELRRPTSKELAATLVLAMPIERWSMKISAAPPDDPPEDVAGDAWAGVVPVRRRYGDPVPAPDLREGIPVPPSVRSLPGAPVRL
jgi:nitroimidazol reductase NimA-like FMN-containing flavoprotein (pyridoxamine 5'-phosphate oxidase superfamily)